MAGASLGKYRTPAGKSKKRKDVPITGPKEEVVYPHRSKTDQCHMCSHGCYREQVLSIRKCETSSSCPSVPHLHIRCSSCGSLYLCGTFIEYQRKRNRKLLTMALIIFVVVSMIVIWLVA